MDRQIVYPAQIPLDSDLLNAQRNAFVGLGHLAGMAYGDNTVAAGGFACTPGTGLAVTIAPGSLLAAGVVDATAYGTLAANGSVLVRQHISRDPVTLSVPGAGATYTVYVTPATVDADDTVLPFYNAADPAVTYAGAGNSGKTAPTMRQDVAQLGIAATAPDGAYPLWTITVPAAATAMTADMIAQAEGAPFYETIPELQASKISKAGDGMTGPLTVLDATAAQNPVALGQLEAMQYVASHPDDGSTNVRITDIQEDASGNLVATMSDGTTQSYAPGSVGIIPATDALGAVYWERRGNILRQSFTVITAYHNLYQPWPFAYKAGTIPVVQALAGSTGNGYVAQVQIAAPQNNISNYVTNAGITLDMPCWAANATAFVSSALPVMLNLTVEGEV